MSLSNAVVLAQMVERLLPTPEVCGSNSVNNKFLHYQLHSIDENKKEADFLQNHSNVV